MFQHISLRSDLDSVTLPFSHAIRAGDFLFVSGQVASDRLYSTDDISPNSDRLSISDQTKIVMENLKAILTEAGTDFDRVVMARIFLKEFRDYDTVNTIYISYLTSDRLPCRTTVGVTGLAEQCAIEIDLIVYCGT
jgi:2-iminobutanoate/2-iminopropanoate deaminase